jgi:protein-S-isoprenylcysteine O-methyltransferase Ste14
VRRAIAVGAGIAIYAVLAVSGAGGIAPFFAEPARIVLIVVLIALSVAALFTEGSLSPGVREDRGNRWVLAVFGLIGTLIGWLPAYTERIGFWTIDGDVSRWIGVALFAAGGVVRLWPVFVLGRRFSGLVAIQPGHALVTTGIYRFIRNPSYLGLLISSFGWGLAFRSGAGLILAALLIPPLVARIHAEERLLQSAFGDEYSAYLARTWRLVPGMY